MGNLSDHFSWDEFACRGESCCGGAMAVDRELVRCLEDLRARLNKVSERGEVRIAVSSGFRCCRHNEAIGGVPGSLHTLGLAADVVPIGATIAELVMEAVCVPGFAQGGIGVYERWVHLDVRLDGPARW